jgi:hypothetical protein
MYQARRMKTPFQLARAELRSKDIKLTQGASECVANHIGGNQGTVDRTSD